MYRNHLRWMLLLTLLVCHTVGFTQTTRALPPLHTVYQGTAIAQATFEATEGDIVDPSLETERPFRPSNPFVWPMGNIPMTRSRTRVGGMLNDERATNVSYFPGTNFTGWRPPDPTLAVGPNHVVVTVNSKVSFFDKNTGNLLFEKWLGNQQSDGFFVPVGALGFCFDPKVIYDRNSNRFIVVVLEYYGNPNRSYIDVAVSDDDNPLGTWYLYRLDAKQTISGTEYWVDYPGVGADIEALYVSGNLFGFSGGFGGVLIRVIPIANILNGGALTFFDIRDSNAGSVQVASSFGPSSAGYCASIFNSSTMLIHGITNRTNNPVSNRRLVSVPGFSWPPGGAPQFGSNNRIDTLDGRLMNVDVRNKRLITSHAIGSGSRTVARWYEFALTDWPVSGDVTLLQSGNVHGGNNKWMLFPAVAYDAGGGIGMIVGQTATDERPSVYVTGRREADPSGTMGSLTLVKAGPGSYHFDDSTTTQRWGDYFDAQIDPVDGVTFWGIGEYVEDEINGSDRTTRWKTWIAKWQMTTFWPVAIGAKVNNAPVVGLPISATNDANGNGSGQTPFSRTYIGGSSFTITAPLRHRNYVFLRWEVNGQRIPTRMRSLTLNATQGYSVIAIYRRR